MSTGFQDLADCAGHQPSLRAQHVVAMSVRDAGAEWSSVSCVVSRMNFSEPGCPGVSMGMSGNRLVCARESGGSRSSSSTSSALAQLGLVIAAGAMASGKGRYALEAAGEAATWDPEKAIEVTSMERALVVRQHFGSADDGDLALRLRELCGRDVCGWTCAGSAMGYSAHQG